MQVKLALPADRGNMFVSAHLDHRAVIEFGADNGEPAHILYVNDSGRDGLTGLFGFYLDELGTDADQNIAMIFQLPLNRFADLLAQHKNIFPLSFPGKKFIDGVPMK